MSKHTPIPLALTLLCSLLLPMVASADNWKVELLVFERPDGSPSAQEVWPQGEQVLMRWQNARTPTEAGRDSLGGAAAALRNSGHRILCHTAWEQGGRAVRLSPCAARAPELVVNASLVEARQPILTLEIGRQVVATGEVRGEEPIAFDLEPDRGRGESHWYVIRETRGQRPGELHYYDHPVIGALALIRPAPSGPESE